MIINPTALGFTVIAIASWRLAYMLVEESGPRALLERLRAAAHIPDCVRCVSVWTAAALLMLWFTPAQPVVWWLAVSGAALGFQSWTGLDRDY